MSLGSYTLLKVCIDLKKNSKHGLPKWTDFIELQISQNN